MQWQDVSELARSIGSHDPLTLFSAPGDFVLSAVLSGAPAAAAAIGVDETSYGGIEVLAVSALFWLTCGFVSMAFLRFVIDVIRTIQAWIRAFVLAGFSKVRALRTMLICWFGSRDRNGRPGEHIATEESLLDSLDTSMLRAQMEMPPGYTMTAAEIAERLGVAVWQAKERLARLHQIELVETGLGTMDGDTGYRLTDLGKQFVGAQARRRVSDVDIGDLDFGADIRI